MAHARGYRQEYGDVEMAEIPAPENPSFGAALDAAGVDDIEMAQPDPVILG